MAQSLARKLIHLRLFGPFRARACLGTGQPRALPWAKLFGPFRASVCMGIGSTQRDGQGWVESAALGRKRIAQLQNLLPLPNLPFPRTAKCFSPFRLTPPWKEMERIRFRLFRC